METVIVLGASTGGPDAIKEFLKQMPANCPGILITQHMPPNYTRSFVQRLDDLCQVVVEEARHGERVLKGHVYVAPGNLHLMLAWNGIYYTTVLSDSPPINHHRPAVDALFQSAAQSAGKNAIGIILTGMGDDGRAGMMEMKKAGAYNFAQDETSCVVFGMPARAINAGVVDEVVSISSMSKRVMDYVLRRNNFNTVI